VSQGGFVRGHYSILAAALGAAMPVVASAQDAPPAIDARHPSAPIAQVTLPAGTPVLVTLGSELTSRTSKLGDRFEVVVADDVLHQGHVAIRKGTTGSGEVTFVTGTGGFGKAGMLGIALRHLNLGDKKMLLDGRYREEGKSGNGAAAATMFAVGIVAGLVRGKTSVIPQGRVLKARTGEDIPFTPGAAVTGAAPPAPAAEPVPAPLPASSQSID